MGGRWTGGIMSRLIPVWRSKYLHVYGTLCDRPPVHSPSSCLGGAGPKIKVGNEEKQKQSLGHQCSIKSFLCGLLALKDFVVVDVQHEPLKPSSF